MELRVEPGSSWRFSSKRTNPELTGGIRPRIPMSPPWEDLGSLVGWRGSGERRHNQTPEWWTRKNAAAVLVTCTRRALIPADEKESEINE